MFKYLILHRHLRSICVCYPTGDTDPYIVCYIQLLHAIFKHDSFHRFFTKKAQINFGYKYISIIENDS